MSGWVGPKKAAPPSIHSALAGMGVLSAESKSDKDRFKAAVKACDTARKSDGKTVVTCPASRHAQMIAEYVGARKPYPMLQEEPEHCAESILSAVASVYRLRLRVYDLEAALVELHRVCASMDLEHEANRPTEAEYIAAMEAAHAALNLTKGKP